MSAPRFRLGDVVAFQPDPADMMRAGRPEAGELGVVSEVATGRGASIYPDPMKSMVFVKWERAGYFGVSRNSAVRLRAPRSER